MSAHRGNLAIALLLLALSAGAGSAQQPVNQQPVTTLPPGSGAGASATPATPSAAPQQSAPPADANSPEVSTQEVTDTTFKVRVNLVEVRAVVLDAQGHAVGNLKQEDFQLFDNGKPQVISKFSVEQAGAKPVIHVEASSEADSGKGIQPAAPIAPERYIAYVFDDVHMEFGDMTQVRDAAYRHLQSLRPTDRAAIFTTSGQNQVDFTDDKDKLHAALSQLRPRPIMVASAAECPSVSYYLADLIQNKHDDQALNAAMQDDISCGGNAKSARQDVEMATLQKLESGNHETQLALGVLKDVVRRISAMPGKRSILLVSPGFYNPEQLQEQMEIAERALHSDVVINALDARGLYTVMPDIRTAGVQPPQYQQYRHDEALVNADVLQELTYATGGRFFHNSNDYDAGFRQLEAPPEFSYLLAFAPQNLKSDGRFHNLKVTAKGPQKLNVQARKGYYAPKQAADASEQARRDIEDEVFSQEELHDIPVQMHTQFFKTSEDDARLAVLVKVDVKHLHYRKAEGRNQNNLTVVSALFDRNGNYVKGNQQLVSMKWKDASLENKLGSGVTLKSSFEVKPGGYLVRLVVRDDNGQVSAQNGAIEIP